MAEDTRDLLNSGRFSMKQIAGPIYGAASGSGAQRVSQTEPEGLELSRAGRRFAFGHSAAITGIAPVQAMPTTAAQWVIWNTSLTKSLVFEMAGAYLVSGVAGIQSTVVGALIALPATTTTKAGITIASMSKSTASTVALINSGVTVTSPAAPPWFIIARDETPCTVVLNVMAFNDNLKGTLIVPPLCGLGLAVIAPSGTSPLYAPMAQWTEVELDLE
jgi:hypothetical protein